MAGNIPDRENLESMSRTDIQKLCKDNNIKANMRTDEMINALCDLVNGKEVPRPHRSMPPPQSHLNSVPPATKPTEVTAKRTALQLSESNTDAESVADTPPSAPTTRRKAKGCPAVARGSGARNLTKVITRGAGRKGKACAMLQENPIPEEDENTGSIDIPTHEHVHTPDINKVTHLSSLRPGSPIPDTATGSRNGDLRSRLLTPAPSHPVYTWTPAQLTVLESRVSQLEAHNLAARLSEVEAALNDIPILKTSIAQIPPLQAEIQRLEGTQRTLEAESAQWCKAHAELQVHVKGLVVANDALRERVKELETRLDGLETVAKDTSLSIHSSRPTGPAGNDVRNGEGVETENDVEKEGAVGTNTMTATIAKAIGCSDLPCPSPSQPTLGKRTRGPTDTPDVSLSDIAVGATHKQREDAELAAIHRLIKPQRKKPRLAIDPDEDFAAFSFFQHGRGGPSSTSTPHHRRSNSPPGFFTAGRRAPTPLVRGADDLSLDIGESAVEEVDTAKSNAIAGPSNVRPSGPPDATPHTSSFKPMSGGRASDAENPHGMLDPVHDPGFFGGPLPVYYTQETQLPFPLRPTTPPNPQDILARSAQLATPPLGEPWKFDGTVNRANISQPGDEVEQPATPGSVRSLASSSNAVPFQSSSDYTFRAGGRKERNDRYNPYFTPPRGPGASHRTGITPTRGFTVSLKSPARMTTVVEGAEAETDEDGVVLSPPNLRTLYGTELGGDTRFGDYGRDLGRYDWGKYVPR